MGKLLTGDRLKAECERLGINTKMERTHSSTTSDAPDAELQRRLIETKRSIREGRLWIFALVSMIISMLSAAAAWYAVVLRR
jgi:hypothetical protein